MGGRPIEIFIAGDALMQFGFARCAAPGFLAVRSLIAKADVAVVNLECCIQAGEDWPAYVGGGGRSASYMATPPSCVRDLKEIGIDAVFAANNHCMDFGEGGILTTIKHLGETGVHHAGIGPSLAAATAPTYVDSPGGRVAILGATDWGPRGLADLPYPWPVGALAADPDPWFKARPGANLLRFDVETHVDGATIAALRRASQELGWEHAKAVRNHGGAREEPLVRTEVFDDEVDDDHVFHFMGRRFVEAGEFTFRTIAYQEDVERNLRWIEEARRNADYVVFGLHQQGATRPDEASPDHVAEFGRAAIEAGADVFVAHGRGRTGGIEFHRGRPIIHGVPGFMNQLAHLRSAPLEQLQRVGLGYGALPRDFLRARTRGESGNRATAHGSQLGPFLLHTVHFDPSAGTTEVRLYPFEELGGEFVGDEGLPSRVSAGTASFDATLDTVAARSRPFGTTLQVSDEGYGWTRSEIVDTAATGIGARSPSSVESAQDSSRGDNQG